MEAVIPQITTYFSASAAFTSATVAVINSDTWTVPEKIVLLFFYIYIIPYIFRADLCYIPFRIYRQMKEKEDA